MPSDFAVMMKFSGGDQHRLMPGEASLEEGIERSLGIEPAGGYRLAQHRGDRNVCPQRAVPCGGDDGKDDQVIAEAVVTCSGKSYLSRMSNRRPGHQALAATGPATRCSLACQCSSSSPFCYLRPRCVDVLALLLGVMREESSSPMQRPLAGSTRQAYLPSRTGQAASSGEGTHPRRRRDRRSPAAPAPIGDRRQPRADRAPRATHPTRSVRRTPAAHRLLLHVEPGPPRGVGVRRPHVGHDPGRGAVPPAFPRHHLRGLLPGTLRRKRPLPRLHGLGHALVLSTRLPRRAPHRAPDRLVPPGVLPAGFTSAEVVYGVADPDVTALPEYGVSP